MYVTMRVKSNESVCVYVCELVRICVLVGVCIPYSMYVCVCVYIYIYIMCVCVCQKGGIIFQLFALLYQVMFPSEKEENMIPFSEKCVCMCVCVCVCVSLCVCVWQTCAGLLVTKLIT